jgi:hypothetical protein
MFYLKVLSVRQHLIKASLLAVILTVGFNLVHVAQSSAVQNPYVKTPWSNCIYNRSTRPVEHVTQSQWNAAGNPTPSTVYRIPGDEVYRYTTSPTELFISSPLSGDPACSNSHHLTLAEWQAMGTPAAYQYGNQFIKTASNPTIYFGDPVHGAAFTPLSYDLWLNFGLPTPQIVSSIPR